MEKIYISGRISGLPIEEVAAKFDETETKLKAQGYEVINPLKTVFRLPPLGKPM